MRINIISDSSLNYWPSLKAEGKANISVSGHREKKEIKGRQPESSNYPSVPANWAWGVDKRRLTLECGRREIFKTIQWWKCPLMSKTESKTLMSNVLVPIHVGNNTVQRPLKSLILDTTQREHPRARTAAQNFDRRVLEALWLKITVQPERTPGWKDLLLDFFIILLLP